MTQLIEAVYENGILRPLAPLTGLKDRQHVHLSIESEKPPHPLLKHCGTLPDEDAREILKIIEDEFEKVDPDQSGDCRDIRAHPFAIENPRISYS